MGKEARLANRKKDVFLLVLAAVVVFIAFFSRGGATGMVWYQDYGYGGSGYGMFPGFGYLRLGDIYSQYGAIIDAALFLLIFLGIGKGLLAEKFGKGGDSVYLGIGIFLAFALLLWEEQTGFYLLLEFGPIVFLIFLLVVLFYAGKMMNASGINGLTVFSLLYLVFYFFMGYWRGTRFEQLWNMLPFWDFMVIQTIMNWIALASVFLLIYSLIKGRKKEDKE